MTIPFPRVRVFRADVVMSLVVFAVVVVLGGLTVVQSFELRGVTRERDVLRQDRDLMLRECSFFEDGSATCPKATFTRGAK